MIYTSDNFETGVVVDVMTRSQNYQPETMNATDPKFEEWRRRRNFTESYFAERGLLEDQVIISKTYPSNSGSMPSGAEALLREVLGQNQMKPKCAASLMAEVALGLIHPGDTEYMLGMLQHARYSYSSVGMGTPPGSVLHNKIGNAYDTLEEVAYIKLPDGYSFILAIYTNGYEPSEPNLNNLSYLTELIIDGLGLSKTLPPKFILGTSEALTQGPGWSKLSTRPDKFGSSYLQNEGGHTASASWVATLPTNIYEVSVWTPENSQFGSVTYDLFHAHGTDSFTLSQRVNGGRWTKLGDFNFEAGTTANITVHSPSRGAFYANAVKFSAWPSCGGVPGTGCNM
jgi:protein phosphatase methylesterase 1